MNLLKTSNEKSLFNLSSNKNINVTSNKKNKFKFISEFLQQSQQTQTQNKYQFDTNFPSDFKQSREILQFNNKDKKQHYNEKYNIHKQNSILNRQNKQLIDFNQILQSNNFQNQGQAQDYRLNSQQNMHFKQLNLKQSNLKASRFKESNLKESKLSKFKSTLDQTTYQSLMNQFMASYIQEKSFVQNSIQNNQFLSKKSNNQTSQITFSGQKYSQQQIESLSQSRIVKEEYFLLDQLKYFPKHYQSLQNDKYKEQIYRLQSPLEKKQNNQLIQLQKQQKSKSKYNSKQKSNDKVKVQKIDLFQEATTRSRNSITNSKNMKQEQKQIIKKKLKQRQKYRQKQRFIINKQPNKYNSSPTNINHQTNQKYIYSSRQKQKRQDFNKYQTNKNKSLNKQFHISNTNHLMSTLKKPIIIDIQIDQIKVQQEQQTNYGYAKNMQLIKSSQTKSLNHQQNHIINKQIDNRILQNLQPKINSKSHKNKIDISQKLTKSKSKQKNKQKQQSFYTQKTFKNNKYPKYTCQMSNTINSQISNTIQTTYSLREQICKNFKYPHVTRQLVNYKKEKNYSNHKKQLEQSNNSNSAPQNNPNQSFKRHSLIKSSGLDTIYQQHKQSNFDEQQIDERQFIKEIKTDLNKLITKLSQAHKPSQIQHHRHDQIQRHRHDQIQKHRDGKIQHHKDGQIQHHKIGQIQHNKIVKNQQAKKNSWKVMSL